MWRIEFTSDKFLPALPETCQCNPGVYGHELAVWLALALHGQGITTSYPLAEDWGFFIECIRGEQEVQIGCSSMSAEGEGYLGKAIDWSIFVKPHRPIKKMFSRAPAPAETAFLTTAIERVLADQGIAVRLVES